MMFWYDEEDKELYVETHLITDRNIFKRAFYAIKYIFGYKSRFGDWDELIFSNKDAVKLRRFLNQIK